MNNTVTVICRQYLEIKERLGQYMYNVWSRFARGVISHYTCNTTDSTFLLPPTIVDTHILRILQFRPL